MPHRRTAALSYRSWLFCLMGISYYACSRYFLCIVDILYFIHQILSISKNNCLELELLLLCIRWQCTNGFRIVVCSTVCCGATPPDRRAARPPGRRTKKTFLGGWAAERWHPQHRSLSQHSNPPTFRHHRPRITPAYV
jgi:hypothetical protein